MGKGTFVIERGPTGGFVFHLRTPTPNDKSNYYVLLAIGIREYKTKDACINAIESFKRNCTHAERWEIFQDKSRAIFVRLRARNHKLVGIQQVFSMDSANKSIANIPTLAPTAEILDYSKKSK